MTRLSGDVSNVISVSIFPNYRKHVSTYCFQYSDIVLVSGIRMILVWKGLRNAWNSFLSFLDAGRLHAKTEMTIHVHKCSDRINPHALIWEMVAFITSHETQTVTIDTINSFSFKCEQGYANRTSHWSKSSSRSSFELLKEFRCYLQMHPTENMLLT